MTPAPHLSILAMASEHTSESEATVSGAQGQHTKRSHRQVSHPHLRHVVATEPGAREPEEEAVEPHLMHRAMAEEEDVRVAEVAEHRT